MKNNKIYKYKARVEYIENNDKKTKKSVFIFFDTDKELDNKEIKERAIKAAEQNNFLSSVAFNIKHVRLALVRDKVSLSERVETIEKVLEEYIKNKNIQLEDK
jgi:hypothetical protein